MPKLVNDITPASPDARDALLRAGAALFAQHGYSATGVQQITDAAGVNKAMLYYYFGSKEGLYDLLIAEGIAAVEAAVGEAESGAGPIAERLQRFIAHYLSIVVEHPAVARILFREVMAGGERARQTVLDHFSNSLQRLAALLASAQRAGELHTRDAGLDAYSLFGMATMFIASHFVAGRPLDSQRFAAHIVDLFLHGAGRDEHTA
ncbi:MAG TPA: TetR/AcrR family transcriptional regulator [Armatimonadota bacterium]|jgi:TetR/AcrR family transcriptional regulator